MGRRVANEAQGGFADRYRMHAVILQLKALRIESGLTQSEVARQMGTTQSAVSDIEALSVDPQVTTLLRYARAVGAVARIQIVEQPNTGEDPSR